MKKDRITRWQEALHAQGTNLQLLSREKPTDEQGFLALTLVSDEGVKQFVVIDTMKLLMARRMRYADFFSTDSKGKKVGASLEWVDREEAYPNTSDEDIEKIRKMMAENIDKFGGIDDEKVKNDLR